MDAEQRHHTRFERQRIHQSGRPQSDFGCAVTCAYCGDQAGRAFNVTQRWFYWTCAKCARTELIVLPSDDRDTQPASVVLWRIRDARGALQVCSLVLQPGSGFELRVTRGPKPFASEVFQDPNVLLNRSRELCARLPQSGLGRRGLRAWRKGKRHERQKARQRAGTKARTKAKPSR